MRRKVKPPITKPYVVPINIDNKPLPYKSLWTHCIGDGFSFTLMGGSEFACMRLARSEYSGKQVVELKILNPK